MSHRAYGQRVRHRQALSRPNSGFNQAHVTALARARWRPDEGHMSPTYHRSHLGHLSLGQISRTRFERLVLLRLDKIRVGTGRNAKRLIGGAWRAIIDDMYERNVERLTATEFASAVTECADAIVHLTKNVKI
jgi:hypothetical protein